MRHGLYSFCLITAVSISALASVSAQHNTSSFSTPLTVKKNITFLVRKPDKVKDIALRFHVPSKAFLQLNSPIRKNQTVYAGKKLMIPVWLRLKNPLQQSTEFDLSTYEIAYDSLDIYVEEDFVNVTAIEADTIRRIAINKELKKIDKKIVMLNLMLDSIEEEGRQYLSKRDIAKLPMNRARRLGNFALGLQVDSLIIQTKKLSIEKTKIDLRVADYQYLLDNEDYAAKHTNKGQYKSIAIHDWADDPTKTDDTAAKNNKHISH